MRADDAPRAPRTRPHARFALRDPHSGAGRSFGASRAAELAAMLRHATLEAARAEARDPAWIERFAAGHGVLPSEKSERLSYLVLPSVGGPDADGRIARALVCEPAGGTGEAARWAQRALGERALRREPDQEPVARLAPAPTPDPLFELAAGPSERWASVTPVVLPGHDDRDPAKAQRLALSAVQHAGLDPALVAELELGLEPFWRRALTADRYFAPAHLRERPRWHLSVRFCEPVAGPLSLGAGRHSGLGVLVVVSAAGEPGLLDATLCRAR